MTADLATPEVTAWFHKRVASTLKLRGESRFVAKYPRLSLRLDWLDAIFPDACFVHVQRDWRAVVNSTVNRQAKRRRRGGGWFGVHIPGWESMSGLPMDAVATRQFVVVTEVLEAAAQRFAGRMVSLSYETLCRDPLGTLAGLLGSVDLPWSAEFWTSPRSSVVPSRSVSSRFGSRDSSRAFARPSSWKRCFTSRVTSQ